MITRPIIKRALTVAIQAQTIISRGYAGPTPPVGCAFPFDDSITALLPGSVPLQVSGTAPVQTVTGPEVIVEEVAYVTSTYNPGYSGFTNDWPADEIRWICQVSDIVPFSNGSMYGDSMMVAVGSLTTGASFYTAVYAFDTQTVLYYGWIDQAPESGSREIVLPFTGMADTLAVGLAGSGDCYVRVNDKTYKVLTNSDTPVNIGVSENLYLLHQISQAYGFSATGPTSYVSRTFADDFIGTFPAVSGISSQKDLCGNEVEAAQPILCAFPFDDSISAMLPGSLPLVISGADSQTISSPAPVDLVDGLYLAGTNVAAPIAVDWPADELRIVERVPVSLLYADDSGIEIRLLHGSGLISLGNGLGVVFPVIWTSVGVQQYSIIPNGLNWSGASVDVNLFFDELPESISVGLTGDGHVYLIVGGSAYPVLESWEGDPWVMDVSAGILLVDFIEFTGTFYPDVTGQSTGRVVTDASQFQNDYPAIPGINKQADLCGTEVAAPESTWDDGALWDNETYWS